MSSTNNIPIFDSLTHPTLNGGWLQGNRKLNAGIDALLEQMKASNTKWAFAVGMKGIGNYDEKKFAPWVLSKTDKLLPIAFIDPDDISGKTSDNTKVFGKLKKMGYVGIKLHPRLSDFTMDNKKLPAIIKAANDAGLPPMLCTYFYSSEPASYKNNIEALVLLLSKVKDEKIVLLHGGTVRLLELAEITRAFKNVLLDLSYTMIKYEGSSIDLDIKYLFRLFDRRICIGSDFPEFTLTQTRERFNYFAEGIEKDKVENIGYKNLLNFIGLK